MKVLVTGAAGFIGSHTSLYLLASGIDVVGIDNLNNYYDVNLKKARIDRINGFCGNSLEEEIYPEVDRENSRKGAFRFIKMELSDRKSIAQLFEQEKFDFVINLAAQAGVRYSLENPFSYVDSNITGFLTILEGCRNNDVKHLVYASSSSVYGANQNMPFKVEEPADHQLALYGATKRANELMAHSYSHLFELPTTGLRFFTVYGPWGRPDMALFKFTASILKGEPIDVFNYGKHKRDFTYIDDIVTGIVATLHNTARPNTNWNSKKPSPESSLAPWRIHNIGNQQPVELLHYISTLENCLGKKAIINLLPLQLGDVPDTYSDVSSLEKMTGYRPSTSVENGIKKFVAWYKKYYNIA